MLLRASGEREGQALDLTAVTSSASDPGVADAQWLRALTEQAIGRQLDQLPATLEAAGEKMGTQAATDALVVAAAFNGITRVADATGIPLDDNTREVTEDLRQSVGLDAFEYAVKSERYAQPVNA